MINEFGGSSAKIILCPRTQISADTIEEGDLATVHFSDMLSLADGAEPPVSEMTQVAVEWNEHSLLVYFRGRFEELRYANNVSAEALQKKSFHLHEISDVYEVIAGPKAAITKIYKLFQVAPDGRWFDIERNDDLGIANPYWYSGYKCYSFIDHEMKIWTAAMEVPWQCFGASYDSEQHWNINFFRRSKNNSLIWNCSDSFGTIQFLYKTYEEE